MKRKNEREISQIAANALAEETQLLLEKREEAFPSLAHRERMEALFNRKKEKEKRHGKTAVAVCTALCTIILLFGVSWFFTHGASPEPAGEIDQQAIYVPEGFSLQENVETAGGERLLYQNEAGKQLTIEWTVASESANQSLVEKENTVVREEDGVTVVVVAALSQEELDKISRSVQIPWKAE